MKKITTHIYIVSIIALVAFVVGSFFDYQINSTLFHNKDAFGLTISVLGTIPGYGVLAFIGGGFLFFGIKKELPHDVWKVVMYLMAFLCFWFAVYFTGKEFFGPNGFDGVKLFWGFFIATPIDIGIAILGYFITSKTDNDKVWVIYLLIALLYIIVLLGGVTLLKSIMHRPRYRVLVEGEIPGVDYHAWYERFSEYRQLVKDGVISNALKEEFKSFPSGHAGSSACFMMSMIFLPSINKKYERLQIPMFYAGLAWTLLVSFARMYVGAHYMSDVAMGSILAVLFFYIGKIVADNLKYLKNEERTQQ